MNKQLESATLIHLTALEPNSKSIKQVLTVCYGSVEYSHGVLMPALNHLKLLYESALKLLVNC